MTDFEQKLKEVEGKCQPIIMKIYQAGGAPGGAEDFGAAAGAGPSASSSASSAGPTVEEVD